MHVLMDGYSDSQDIFQDEGSPRTLLTEYPPRIGMTRISEPYVIRHDDRVPDEWGISGFVFPAERHTATTRHIVGFDVVESAPCAEGAASSACMLGQIHLPSHRTCLPSQSRPGGIA